MPVDEIYRRQAALLVQGDTARRGRDLLCPEGRNGNQSLCAEHAPTFGGYRSDVPAHSRSAASLKEIDAAMRRIADAISRGIPGARVGPSRLKGENCVTKLIVRADDAQIKIEVTPVLRGCVYEPAVKSVSARVEDRIRLRGNPDRQLRRPLCRQDRRRPRPPASARSLRRAGSPRQRGHR